MEGLVAEHWQGKKVLVTGHTGFKGSWLCMILSQLGAEICGVSLEANSDQDIFHSANVQSALASHHIVDIRDRDGLDVVFADFQPEVVIHMAAQALVRYSYENPLETYEVNVIGTLNVLDMCRKYGSNLSAILVITTDKCYENKEQIWAYRETDAMGGYDPYSSSKGCCELLVASYRSSYFSSADSANLASARAGNVIGGGDWSLDRLVPDVIRAKIANEKVVIRNPASVRPWQHVLEPLAGYLLLCQKMLSGDTSVDQGWNFGPEESDVRSVGYIISKINELWDNDDDFVVLEKSELHEANLLKLDSTKAKTLLNWQPQLSIDECLDNVVAWYKAQCENQDLHAVTMKQISNYFGLA
ncbi:MAG: CDP-glucose 4,6-dehydratase [Phenylobacterium sp.]|jgi:CDP-glucose 4,6-dehydratase